MKPRPPARSTSSISSALYSSLSCGGSRSNGGLERGGTAGIEVTSNGESTDSRHVACPRRREQSFPVTGDTCMDRLSASHTVRVRGTWEVCQALRGFEPRPGPEPWYQ